MYHFNSDSTAPCSISPSSLSSIPESHVVSSCYASLVSFNLNHILSQPLSFVIETILKSTNSPLANNVY